MASDLQEWSEEEARRLQTRVARNGKAQVRRDLNAAALRRAIARGLMEAAALAAASTDYPYRVAQECERRAKEILDG